MPFSYFSHDSVQNLMQPEFELPQLVVKKAALDHNIAVMADFCKSQSVSIAPHVKTTMAPAIIERQLAAGAWGITVATMQQLRACLDLSPRRVLLANELVNIEAVSWLGRRLPTTRTDDVYCLADSREGAARLSAGWGLGGNPRPLLVLVEMGVAGGRAGCRSAEEVADVAVAIAEAPGLALAGIEAFEGILGSFRGEAEIARVDAFLGEVAYAAKGLDRMGLFSARDEIVLSAGGSLFFDRVVEQLKRPRLSRPVRVVIRSGCYVTHDHGTYNGLPLLADSTGSTRFRPALELWSEVLSLPESGLAIAGFGRRHTSFDAGLPVVVGKAGPSGPKVQTCQGATVTALNDQHAYLRIGGAQLEIGDRLVCGVVHPCTAFDKWKAIPLVDDDYNVIETMETRFS